MFHIAMKIQMVPRQVSKNSRRKWNAICAVQG